MCCVGKKKTPFQTDNVVLFWSVLIHYYTNLNTEQINYVVFNKLYDLETIDGSMRHIIYLVLMGY